MCLKSSLNWIVPSAIRRRTTKYQIPANGKSNAQATNPFKSEAANASGVIGCLLGPDVAHACRSGRGCVMVRYRAIHLRCPEDRPASLSARGAIRRVEAE